VWLLKLLAELNHRRWFSATDIDTELGGAGALPVGRPFAPRSAYSSVVRRENGYYIETLWHGIGIVYRRWSMHYERAPCFRRLKQMVWRGLHSAAPCRGCAALRPR
jgi:hypothetical protein